MKIIFDLVVNHTSDQHKWFQESRSSKDNPKRDWYIWRPARYDENGRRMAPNNWRGNFSTPAWTWDEHTQEYYLHLFAKEQPDLNWENDDVRRAIWEDVCEFWLKKGVNGFRVDTVNMYSKGDMADAPITEPGEETQHAGLVYCNGPRMGEFLSEMNAVMAKYDAFTVGECPNTPDMARVTKYVSAKEKQLNMVFQFDVVDVSREGFANPNNPPNFSLTDFKSAIARTQNIIDDTDAWTTAFLENHDQARSVSRFASDLPEHREASARMLALFLVTLSGTLFLYQGQELGLKNVPIEWPVEEYKDLLSQNWYEWVKRDNPDAQTLSNAKRTLQYLARDHARVPMQWDASPNAGFTNGTPWMRVNDDYKTFNAAAQEKNADSVLAYWRKMLKLRQEYKDLFVYGNFKLLDEANTKTLAFTKTYGGQKAVVVLNFSKEVQPSPLPEGYSEAKLVVGTKDTSAEKSELAPFEGRVYLV
jgi:alpha-glucosidase